VNKVVLGGNEQTDLTDLDMYYYKVARAYGNLTGRNVVDYPSNNDFETYSISGKCHNDREFTIVSIHLS
jgi:hypothetical protein